MEIVVPGVDRIDMVVAESGLARNTAPAEVFRRIGALPATLFAPGAAAVVPKLIQMSPASAEIRKIDAPVGKV